MNTILMNTILAIYFLLTIVFFVGHYGAEDPVSNTSTYPVHSKDEFHDIYFMPKDGQLLRERLIDLINEAEKSINIAMYNMNDTGIILALENAHSKGIDVTLYLDRKKSKKIHINVPHKVINHRKMHLKIAIFDGKVAYTGSANWKTNSFSDNYDLGVITNNVNQLTSYKIILDQLK